MIGYMSLGGSRAFDCTESSPGDGHNGRTVRQSHVQSRCLPCTYPRIEISTFSLANVAKSSSFYTVSNRRAPDYLMTIVVRVIFSRDQWALKGQSDHRPTSGGALKFGNKRKAWGGSEGSRMARSSSSSELSSRRAKQQVREDCPAMPFSRRR
jgi:hypothetical protein